MVRSVADLHGKNALLRRRDEVIEILGSESHARRKSSTAVAPQMRQGLERGVKVLWFQIYALHNQEVR